jgi:hypothetical protein
MILAAAALRCQCADVEMELTSQRRAKPLFREPPDGTGIIQTFKCPKCNSTIVRAIPPKGDEYQYDCKPD